MADVERPSIFTNHFARNQEFGFLTLQTKVQSPKHIALQDVYMAIFFDQSDGFLKEA